MNNAQEVNTTLPSGRRKYETPKVTVMDEAEVLKAFQMTASQISAAGCWWMNSSWTS